MKSANLSLQYNTFNPAVYVNSHFFLYPKWLNGWNKHIHTAFRWNEYYTLNLRLNEGLSSYNK